MSVTSLSQKHYWTQYHFDAITIPHTVRLRIGEGCPLLYLYTLKNDLEAGTQAKPYNSPIGNTFPRYTRIRIQTPSSYRSFDSLADVVLTICPTE
jgi:hypothetical protein